MNACVRSSWEVLTPVWPDSDQPSPCHFARRSPPLVLIVAVRALLSNTTAAEPVQVGSSCGSQLWPLVTMPSLPTLNCVTPARVPVGPVVQCQNGYIDWL